MKRLILTVLVLMFTVQCWAGVSAEILDVCQDEANGSIIVKTQYKIDGVEVESRYPQLDGKYYWVTRYNIDKFAGMTDAQAKSYILNDLSQFCKTLIKKKYFQQANFVYTQEKAELLIGTTGTVNTADVYVDTDADNIVDTIWHVKTDGTRTEEPYTPPE